jgi:glycosyltransferase involved in cell wall biosynthesis
MEGLFNRFMAHLSVVIPVYNESSLIDELVKRVKTNVKLITEDFEIIIVDDGSKDNTWSSIESEAKSENRIKGVKFSRNFGHHYAITAGLHYSSGEWVVVMDGDLQDRPEVIPEMYEKVREGYDALFVTRIDRPESFTYLLIQKIFYSLLNNLSGIKFDSRQANFSILSRKVVEAFKKFPESTRFYGSIIKWLGFEATEIKAEHGLRFSGKPSYTLRKRVKLAADIILTFSDRPLKLAIGFGITMASISVIGALRIFWGVLYSDFEVMGWASLMTAIFFVGGSILTVLGILGIYLGKVFDEVKKRPLYVIDEVYNLK